MAATDLTSIVTGIASGPASVSTGAGSVTQQSVDAVIKADQYAAAAAAVKTKRKGLRLTKLITPGPYGSSCGRYGDLGGCP